MTVIPFKLKYLHKINNLRIIKLINIQILMKNNFISYNFTGGIRKTSDKDVSFIIENFQFIDLWNFNCYLLKQISFKEWMI